MAAEMPAGNDPPIQHRIAPIANALMKHARTQEKGHEMLQTILRGGTLPAELNFPICTGQELEMAFAKCVPMWEKNKEKDIDELVQSIQEKSWSTMDVDERCRRLAGTRIGSKMRRGILTQEVLSAAQAKCHEYWSRVTPGNVATVVEKMTSKCSDWKSAESKFDWIWKQGDWTQQNRSVDLNGRIYTAEDLEQAERRCRTKFGQPASGERRIERNHVGRKREAPKDDVPPEPAEPAEPAALPSGSAPEAPPVPPALPAAEAKQADEPEQRRAVPQAMSEFLAQRVLGRCNSVESAEKFFVWLREQAQAGEHIRGRPCTLEDVALAEQRCKEEWARKDSGKVHRDDGADTSSSSSSSDSDEEKEKKKKESQGGVDELVEYVKRKTSNKAKIEQYFNGLFAKVGQKVRAVGRPMSHAEITEAWMRCTQEEEPKKKPRPQRAPSRRTIAAPKEESNADYMVHQILQKCSDLNKAQHYINWLHENVGKPTPSGRTFALDEVTEAELRVLQFFEEGGGDQAASSSSDSESSSLKPRRGRRKNKEELKKSKSKKELKRKRTVGAEELEGALFGSDSEELSGEESVDEEQTVGAEVWADLGDVNETALEDGYPVQHWEELTPEVLPGLEGFNRRATAVMIKAQVGQGQLQVKFDEKAACPPLQPHQEAVSFLMHPKSPISRLLVDHPTGSGKTREMIKVLDNYFFDSRAKIPIFPKDPVCRNFYAELLRWPNRYRDYFCCERPADAAIACGKPEWKGQRNYLWDLSGFPEEEVRRLCYSIREVLEMKGMFFMGRVRRSLRAAFHKKNPGECMPAAPLRALGYTSAGGCFATIGKNGKPLSALMKIGYASGGNVYSNKIVLMDEAHNLVRSQTQYAEQLQRLRRLLFEADRLVLAGFTGTPILSEPNEGRQLLDIVKGVKAPTGDEGFLSSFPMRPQPLFPVSLPRGLPDGALTIPRKKQLVRRVEMRGEALKVYDLKRRLGLPGRRLRAYCNVCIFHAAFHDGRAGSKGRVLAYPDDCCPKLLQIAQAVVAEPLKSVIMIGRTSGFVVMLELMKRLAEKADPPFQVATMNELSEFNHCSNLRGEKFRVLVADSLQCSEGVSFLSVRKTFLADVPVSPSGFIQQCGRSIRMYGHRGLPDEEQTVTTQLYVTMLPKWMRSSSLACWALRAQKKHTSGKEVEKKARILTARMNRAGIHSLEELKGRLDAHGEAKMRSLGRTTKEGLTVEDVLTFLEQNGLWEEARLLRNADKKDKEKEKANDEIQDVPETQLSRMESGVSESQLARGNTAESLNRGGTLEEDDLQTALASMLEEVLEKDEEMALAGAGPAAGDEKRQELEALKEEQRADADELDGEEKSKAPAPTKAAPFRRLSSKAFSISGSEVADKTASNLSAADMVAALGEVLSALRAACRDAEKKPEKSLTGEKTEKSTGEDLPDAAPPSDRPDAPSEKGTAGDVEMAAADVASEPADGKGAGEAGKAAEVATAPPAEAPPAEVPAASEAAPEAVPPEAVPPEAVPPEAVPPEAVPPEAVPPEAVPPEAVPPEAVPPEAAADPVPAPAPAPVFGQEPWRAPLVAALEKAQVNGGNAFAAARSAIPSLDPATCDLKMISLHQVRALRDEVAKVEKVETLRMAVSMIKEVKNMIAELQAPPKSSASKDPPAAAPEPAQPPAPDAAAAPPAAAADPAAPAPADAVDPPVEQNPAAAENAEAPAPVVEAPVAEPAQPAAETLTPEQRQEKELRWRRALAKAFRELRRSEHVKAALEVAAPGVMEKTMAAEAKVDAEKDPTQEEEEDSDLLSLGIGPEHVKRLHDELARLLELAEKGVTKPRAMVRAMQMLYLADSTSEAIASLKPETADEEALQQLAERTEEFAPALEAMRSLAVDRDVFAHLAEDLEEEHPQVHSSESEASDLDKELVGKKIGPAPVVLPPGWRMEWVKRKKNEMREFVDPEGNRYRNVREVRAALLEHEARQAALAAAKKAQEAMQQAANEAANAAANAPKRRRLRGKCPPSAFVPGAPPAAAAVEDAFAEDLMKALGLQPEAPSPAKTPAAPKADSASLAKKDGPQTGCKVRLKDCEKPTLNGKLGRLGDFDAKSGCWECFMETGGKVHAKEAQLELLSGASTAKRKAPPTSARSAMAAATVSKRGRGRGRGRGQKAAAEDSD